MEFPLNPTQFHGHLLIWGDFLILGDYLAGPVPWSEAVYFLIPEHEITNSCSLFPPSPHPCPSSRAGWDCSLLEKQPSLFPNPEMANSCSLVASWPLPVPRARDSQFRS